MNEDNNTVYSNWGDTENAVLRMLVAISAYIMKLKQHQIDDRKTHLKPKVSVKWRAVFFFLINTQSHMPLDQLTKKVKDPNKFREEKKHAIICTKEIKIQELLKTTVTQKFENSRKPDRFLYAWNILQLRHEDIENLNWQTANTENESVMNSFPRNRNSGPDCFIAESYQTLKRRTKLQCFSNCSK